MRSVISKKASFQNLRVWQEAHKLTLETYKVIREFPKEEKFILTDQIRRAVISIPNNIAEGKGRRSNKELSRFLYIARGSLEEVRYLLILSKDLRYLDENNYKLLEDRLNSVGKLLNAFINSIRS